MVSWLSRQRRGNPIHGGSEVQTPPEHVTSGLLAIASLAQDASRPDIDAIAREVHRVAAELLNTSNFFLALYDEVHDIVTFRFATEGGQEQSVGVDHWKPRQAGNGITEFVLRTRRSLHLSRDVGKWLTAHNVHNFGPLAMSWLGVPMLIHANSIGVIAVQDYERANAYGDSEQSVLESIARQAAIVIHLTHQEYEIRRFRVSESVLRQRHSNYTDLARDVLQQSLDLSHRSAAALLLANPTSKRIRVAEALGTENIRGKRLNYGEGVAGTVALTERPIIENNYPSSQYFPKDQNSQIQCSALVAVPLLWQGELLGVLALYEYDANRYFTDDDVQLLLSIGNRVALAISHIRRESYRRALFDASPYAVIAVDRRGNVTMYNSATIELFGYDGSALLTKNVVHLYWGGEVEARRVQSLLNKTGFVQAQESSIRSSQDERIPVLVSAGMIVDEDGEKIGSIGIIEDLRLGSLRGPAQRLISALNSIENETSVDRLIDTALLEIAALIDADQAMIVTKSPDGIIVSSSTGYAPGSVSALNEFLHLTALGRVIDSGQPEVVSDYGHSEFDPIDPESVSALVLPVAVTGSEPLGYFVAESPMLQHFRIDEVITTISSRSAIAISRAQLREERARTRDGLLQSAQAVAAGQIATGFVHEVKNAMQSLKLIVTNIETRLNREQAIRAKKPYLDKIKSVRELVDHLTDLSLRLQKFGQRFQPIREAHYVNDIVRSVFDVIDASLRARRINLILRLDPALDPTSKDGGAHPIVVDRRQIEQVIINLLLNAINVTEPRGRIDLVTKNFVDRVEILVRDYGSGIKEEDRPHIFEPFFTTRTEGIGLGLYVSNLIVKDSHGGQIRVDSRPGAGSTFTVALPRG